MKHLRETFTDEEMDSLSNYKKLMGKNWHDFIMAKVPELVLLTQYPVPEQDINAIIVFAKSNRENKITVSLKKVES
jgi:hypothetical protein